MPNQLRSKGGSASRNYDNIRGKSSTTDELVHLLREQASWRQQETALGVGSADLDYTYSLPARKRQLSLLGDDPVYSNPRGYPRSRTEGVFPAVHPSGFSPDVGMTSLPYYHQQDFSYPSAFPYGADGYPNSSQTRGGAVFNGRSRVYRRH